MGRVSCVRCGKRPVKKKQRIPGVQCRVLNEFELKNVLVIIIAGKGVFDLQYFGARIRRIKRAISNIHSFSSPKSQYKTTLPTVLNWSALHVNHFQTINLESA